MPGRLDSDPIALASSNWRDHGWAAAAPGMAAVTSVMRAYQLLLGRADTVLQPFGLTFARYEVLMLLSFTRAGELPAGKIGERLQVHPASVTNALDRLEAQSFVVRKPNPADGRSVLAAITGDGREVAALSTEGLNTKLFEALPLSERDLRQLFDVLHRLRREFGDFA